MLQCEDFEVGDNVVYPHHGAGVVLRKESKELLGEDRALVIGHTDEEKVVQLAHSLDGPPYNLVLHTAPLKEQVDGTYHWHWEIHPRLREIAGLELGTGLPVNPVSPEDAVEELLAAGALSAADPEGGGSG